MNSHVIEDASRLSGEVDKEACHKLLASALEAGVVRLTCWVLLIKAGRVNSVDLPQIATVNRLLEAPVRVVIYE